MGWDDQDDKNRKKGPWGAKPSEPSSGKDEDYGDLRDQRGQRPPSDEVPPDIDTVLRQAQEKFGNAFGYMIVYASSKCRVTLYDIVSYL